MKRLRDALGDSAESARYVETVARRGYRLIAPVGSPGSTVSVANVREAATDPPRRDWQIAAAVLAVLVMGTGGGWVLARRVNPKVSILERRLTSNAQDDPIISAAISPDGKYLAFADRAGLFMRVVTTGETHSMALPGTGKERELTQFARSSELKFNWTLSGDGSMLAMAAWRQGQQPGEIQIFSINTGKQRTLTLNGFTRVAGIDWAADSRSIWASACDLSGIQTLLKVDLHGRTTPMLQDTQRAMGWAIPSPDGRRVAIWQAGGSSNVWSLQGF